MNYNEERNGNLLSSQEPHQKEEMDQATRASTASFTLEPEKGLTVEPEAYNKDGAQRNIKQVERSDRENFIPSGNTEFDPVNDADLNQDENSLTNDDLQALGGDLK